MTIKKKIQFENRTEYPPVLHSRPVDTLEDVYDFIEETMEWYDMMFPSTKWHEDLFLDGAVPIFLERDNRMASLQYVSEPGAEFIIVIAR